MGNKGSPQRLIVNMNEDVAAIRTGEIRMYYYVQPEWTPWTGEVQNREIIELALPDHYNDVANQASAPHEFATNPVGWFLFQNPSTEKVYISFDGGNTFFTVYPNGQVLIDRIPREVGFKTIHVKADVDNTPFEILYREWL